MTDHTAPEIMYCAPSEAGGWADAHAGDWPSPANPKDTKYIRADLFARAIQTALEMAAQRAHADAGRYDTPDRIRAITVKDVLKKMENPDD